MKDRFEQIRIAREDIAFVVANRLLRKSDEQLARIPEHLRPFTPLYTRLAERLDEFARLYPVHPAYIDTFERVYIAEKREVLRTLSRAMAALLDQEIPPDQPGLSSYDPYWNVLRENPSMRRTQRWPRSSRRATSSPVGSTAPTPARCCCRWPAASSTRSAFTASPRATSRAARRDPRGVAGRPLSLGRLAEPTAEFLLDQVRVALREIMRTVSGQYISRNEANDQYYLDVKRTSTSTPRSAGGRPG